MCGKWYVVYRGCHAAGEQEIRKAHVSEKLIASIVQHNVHVTCRHRIIIIKELKA